MEVRNLLARACARTVAKTAHGRVRDTLTERRSVLEALLAKQLIEKEVLDLEALPSILAAQRA